MAAPVDGIGDQQRINPSAGIVEPADGARLAAITGASGFIGRRLTLALAQSGWRLRLLLRREPQAPEWAGLRPQVVPGSVHDRAALERLVDGATAVIHVAGLVKAARRSQFLEVNRDGAAALAEAARALAPRAHFVLVSSIAAREPALSDYAASKRAGEDAVIATLGARVTVLRPAAVYGPADRETLRFFQLARGRFVPVPGPARSRAALIHVADLARLIVAIAGAPPEGRVLAAADGHPQGYEWREVMAAAARAVGNRGARLVRAPGPVLRAVALGGDVARMFGSAAMLNSQKLRELRHPDWSVAPREQALPPGWSPCFDLESGFADAAAWYRAAGWLPP